MNDDMKAAFTKAGLGGGDAKKCPHCGENFIPREAHHKLCSRCNRERRPNDAVHVAGHSTNEATDYLALGYFDTNKVLREELVTSKASEIAKSLVGRDFKNHQLRRFYGHAKAAENRLRMTGDWLAVNVDIKKLWAFAAEAKGKKKIPDTFYAFIDSNIKAIKTSEDFLAFMQHFEAVVAFFTYHNPNRN